MNVICYVCNKESSEWCRNFIETKSQRTSTPIDEFIKSFLDDFPSLRNIDDDTNCICVDCLQQIDDYDWMQQQADQKKTQLRNLLLATEMKVSVIDEGVDTKYEVEDYQHDTVEMDGFVIEAMDTTGGGSGWQSQELAPNDHRNDMNFASEYVDKVADSEMQVQCDADATDVYESKPKPVLPPPPAVPLLSSVPNDVPKLIPRPQPNGMRTFVRAPQSPAKQNHSLDRQNDGTSAGGWQATKTIPVPTTATPNLTTCIRSPVKTTTTQPSIDRRESSANGETASDYPPPAYQYAHLIALALKNSHTGALFVSEIYDFISEHFPFFRTTSIDWKQNVRSCLSVSAHFEKIKKRGQNKPFAWKIVPAQVAKLYDEIERISHNPQMPEAMDVPQNLPALVRGRMKHGGINRNDKQVPHKSIDRRGGNSEADYGGRRSTGRRRRARFAPKKLNI